MSFPVRESATINSTGANSTAHVINTPAGVVSGDLLIAFIALENITSPGGGQFSGWTDGFTEIMDKTTGGAAGASMGVAWKISDGTEGSDITVTSVDSERSVQSMYRFSNFDPAIAPEITAGASGLSSSPDPDSLSPAGGIKEYMFIALCGYQDNTSPISGFPTGYTNSVAGGGASGATIGISTKNINGVSEDPSTYSMSPGPEEWQAFTLAIHPIVADNFPVVETTEVSDTIAAATNHIIDTPAGIVSGDLLIAFICLENVSSPAAQFSNWSDGFIEIRDKTFGGAAGASIGVAYKISDGTEGTDINVDSVDSEEGVSSMFRISGHEPTIPPEISAGDTGTDDEPDPDSLAPSGGVKDFLYGVLEGHQQGGGALITGFPTDYDDNQINEVEGGGTVMGIATRNLAANPEDPGIFTLSTSQNHQAFTWAVHPPAPTTVALTGTATASIDEDDVVAGGETIILTLANDTWAAAGAAFNAVRQAIIDGLNSEQSEATGWNAEVRDNEVVTAVVRTSDTIVTITLTAQAAYDIGAQETIKATIPASALVTSAIEVAADPSFTVDVGPAAAVVTGSLVPDGDEGEIVAGGQTFIVTLVNDTWVTQPAFDGTRSEIRDGFTSMQSELTGWNNEVRDKMPVTDIVRTSDTVMTVTLSAQAGYDIAFLEEIEITIPGAALVITVGPVIATPTFDVLPVPEVTISGSGVPSSLELQIVNGGQELILTLSGDTWVSAGAAFNAIRQDIIDGLNSAQSEATGWNAEVRDKMPVTDVVRTSGTVVTITLTAQAAYQITAQETITATIPTSAMTGAPAPFDATPTFNVNQIPTAIVGGTIAFSSTEDQIRVGGRTILLFLTDDTWVTAGATFNAQRQNIIDGLVSAQSEAAGWNAEIVPNLPVGAVVRTSNTLVTITLIARNPYDITLLEEITVTIPGTALSVAVADLIALPDPGFQITPITTKGHMRDRRGGAHEETGIDVNEPDANTFDVNTF